MATKPPKTPKDQPATPEPTPEATPEPAPEAAPTLPDSAPEAAPEPSVDAGGPEPAPEPEAGPEAEPGPPTVYVVAVMGQGKLLALGWLHDFGGREPEVGAALVAEEVPVPWFVQLPSGPRVTVLEALKLAIPPTSAAVFALRDDALAVEEAALAQRADAHARYPRPWGLRTNLDRGAVAEGLATLDGRARWPLTAESFARALWRVCQEIDLANAAT